MNGLTVQRTGNYVKTDWLKTKAAAAPRHYYMQQRILRLEKEIDSLRQQVKDKSEACATMKEISVSMATLTHELHKLATSFYAARAILLNLSAAERIVFDLLISNRGIKNKEIANKLCIHEQTVKFHIASILRKAGVRSRNEL